MLHDWWMAPIICQTIRKSLSDVWYSQSDQKREVLSVLNYQLLFPPEDFRNNWQIMQVPQLAACGLHVTAAAWFPHASTSVCTTEEEEVEIMKYRNLWKRGSFRKRACLTEIPRIMEKWQKGKHGKGIIKQLLTETLFFFSLQESCFHREPPREHKYPNARKVSYREGWSEIYRGSCLRTLFQSNYQ